jgi:hypothetical protein
MAELVSLTQLQRFSAGEREMAEAVLREVLSKLHEIAVRELRRERYIAPLSPPCSSTKSGCAAPARAIGRSSSREQSYAIASLAVRRVPVDFARARSSQLRRHQEESLTGSSRLSMQASILPNPEDLLQMGLLMERPPSAPESC